MNKENIKHIVSYRTGLLSPREVEVLTLVARGHEYAEIARILSMSKTTVKDHVERIGIKLNTANRANSVAVAVSAGLIKL
ncbi:MAG: helix-turn-helix transcriptional regulator [Alphaproteobacteria bacterium]|nr:helix-turn-helix transcriptional regulator [Alphaproteobacteria bacterium]